jgi:hypothetical protein
MTTWAAGGPTFTLTTDRLAESEACIGDNDLQPAKLAMRVRFPSPARPIDQLGCPSLQVRRSIGAAFVPQGPDPC